MWIVLLYLATELELFVSLVLKKLIQKYFDYVTKLFKDGYFRTPEGIVVSAADYFLILYLDADIKEKRVGQQIPLSIANQIPANLLREIQSFAFTEPLTWIP